MMLALGLHKFTWQVYEGYSVCLFLLAIVFLYMRTVFK